MEPEGSLPHSQVPATCPYPEPARSSPCPHIPLPEEPIYAWVSSVVSFPQVSPPKPCTRLSSPKYALHAPPISFFPILSPEQYWAITTDHSAPHYVIFSTPITSSLLGPNILLNTLFSNTPNLRSSLNMSDQVSHPFKTTSKIIVLYILILKFLDSKLEDKRFCTE
jgi:hypothetical protein